MENKLQIKEYGISTLKGLIGAIPFAGTFLNEISFEARSRIKQERINIFVEQFGEYMNKHSEIRHNLEELNSEQIGDVFEEILVSVSKTSAKHKKEILKKILFNQFTLPNLEIDETLRFINITNELTSNQFIILSAFNSVSDTMLKNKIQLLELEEEVKQLKKQISNLEDEYVGNPDKINTLKERLTKLPKLISKKRSSLKSGKINPNYHTTFGIKRDVYISEVQDLIAKGLLFDFAIRTQIIDPFVHFGVTHLGRHYLKYILS